MLSDRSLLIFSSESEHIGLELLVKVVLVDVEALTLPHTVHAFPVRASPALAHKVIEVKVIAARAHVRISVRRSVSVYSFVARGPVNILELLSRDRLPPWSLRVSRA